MTTDNQPPYRPRATIEKKLARIRVECAAPVTLGQAISFAVDHGSNAITAADIEARRGLFEPLRMNFDGIGEQLRELNVMGQEQDEQINHGY
jgi:hypothetical protein